MSKQHFKWRFELEEKKVIIEVLSSKLSGRKRVFKDGFLIHEEQAFQGVYVHTFSVGCHSLTVLQSGENFELRIDNISFLHVLAQEKVKRAFVYEDQQPKQQQQQEQQQPQQMQTFDFGNNQSNLGQNQSQNFGQGFGGNTQSQQTSVQQPAKRPVKFNQDDPWAEVARARQEVLANSTASQAQAQQPQPDPIQQPNAQYNPQYDQKPTNPPQSQQFQFESRPQPNQSSQFQAYPRPQIAQTQYNTQIQPVQQSKYQFGGFQRPQQQQHQQKRYDDTFFEEPQTVQQKQQQQAVSIPLNDLLKMPKQEPVQASQNTSMGFSFDFGNVEPQQQQQQVQPASFDFGQEQMTEQAPAVEKDLLDISAVPQQDQTDQKIQDLIKQIQTEATQPAAYPELDGINLQSQLDMMDDLDAPLQAKQSSDLLKINEVQSEQLLTIQEPQNELDDLFAPNVALPVQPQIVVQQPVVEQTDLLADLQPKVEVQPQAQEAAGFSFDFGGQKPEPVVQQQASTQFQFEF